MKGLFMMFFFAIAMLAVGMMVLGAGGDEVVAKRAPVLSETEQRVEGAHSRGATLFQYKGTESGMALCIGTSRILSLNENVKEIRLTSQEAIDLTLCKFDSATGNYYSAQAIPGTEPGDFLSWDTSGKLNDTKHTPR